MIKELLDLLHYYYNRFHDELWVNIHFSSRSKKERSWWFMYVFVWIDFQNVSASLFIAIKRQWCLECILKFEGFAKTIDFLLCSDLHICIAGIVVTSWSVKARSHGVICSVCDSSFLHAILWNCSHSAMSVDVICYVYVNWGAYCIPWNHTLQLHGMGIQPNCVWCRTHQCIARIGNHTIWTPSLTPAQSIFHIANAKKKIAPCERAFTQKLYFQNVCHWIC